MTKLSRLAAAAALIGSLSGMAHAQALSQPSQAAPDRSEAVSEGRSVVVDRMASVSGVTPPSESQTVMGLSVPR